MEGNGFSNAAVNIGSGEIAEPLGDGRVIIQRKDGYRFGSDAIALSHFAAGYVRGENRVADLCSGCGIIGIQLAIDTGAEIVGAEIDETLCDMSVRSCALNGLSRATFYNADVRRLPPDIFKASAFDAVVCNPPFFKANSKPSAVAPTANSEITVTFGDIASAAYRLLKLRGAFFLVHTCSRLDEVLSVCRSVGLTPKDIKINSNRKTFLLRAVKCAKDGLSVDIGEF
ncbi:MAG: methyltransferase [Roseburia sp.]|nr:methyltransferase [Roseburia sp.]